VGAEAAELLRGAAVPEDFFVARGPLARLAKVTAIPELASAEALLEKWTGREMLRAWAALGDSPRELFPNTRQARILYRAGFNMLLQRVERIVPAIDRLCKALDADLNAPKGTVFAEAFFAKNGAGAWPHFDSNITLNCQIAGTKRWWLAKNPALRLPPTGMSLRLPAPAEIAPLLRMQLPKRMPEDSFEMVAVPGDVVFIPPGTLHATRVEGGEDESLAILFTMDPTTLSDRAYAIARRRLRKISGLRHAHAHSRDARDGAKAASVLRKLASDLEARAVAL